MCVCNKIDISCALIHSELFFKIHDSIYCFVGGVMLLVHI